MKIGMVSLGCPKNLVDSEVMLGIIKDRQLEITNDPADAELIIVNTCGFIESAKEESISTILQMAQYKEEGSCKYLIMTGCLGQRYADELFESMPEVDAIVGTDSFTDIGWVIDQVLAGKRVKHLQKLESKNVQAPPRMLTTPGYMAYLKIAEGCDNCCSYCIIPQLRGPYTSRPYDEVMAEARSLAAHGVKELIVVAQDTTRYGEDLTGKLRERIPGITIRTTFIVGFPGETDEDFAELMDFVEKQRFENAGVFQYSQEEGTVAGAMENQIEPEVKENRYHELMALQAGISEEIHQEREDEELDVIVEGFDEENPALAVGRSYHEAPDIDGNIFIENAAELEVGQMVRVRILQGFTYEMVAELV